MSSPLTSSQAIHNHHQTAESSAKTSHLILTKRQTDNREETLHHQTDMLRTTIARTLRVNRIVMLRPYSEGATGSGSARPGGEASGFVIRFSTFDKS